MANISNNGQRSHLAQRAGFRSGPAGMHHNAQDFSELVSAKYASRHMLVRTHWEFLPTRLLAKSDALSTTFRGVPINTRSGQFEFALG